MAKPRSWQAKAKDRGRRFEGKVAKLLPGAYIWTGHDGDVRFPATPKELWGIECKYVRNFDFFRTDTFAGFLDQVERYVTQNWSKDMHWALAITGGKQKMHKPLSKSGTFILISVEEFVRLTSAEKAGE